MNDARCRYRFLDCKKPFFSPLLFWLIVKHRQHNTAPPHSPPFSGPAPTTATSSVAALGLDSSSSSSSSSLSFGLDPYTAKQMAALQATSLAKAANRSAPGGTSGPNFGGLSMNQLNSFSRSDTQDSTHHPFPDLQASNQHLNVSSSISLFFRPSTYLMLYLLLWHSPNSLRQILPRPSLCNANAPSSAALPLSSTNATHLYPQLSLAYQIHRDTIQARQCGRRSTYLPPIMA